MQMESTLHTLDDIEQRQHRLSALGQPGPNLLADLNFEFGRYKSMVLDYAENAAGVAINQTASNLPGSGLEIHAQGVWSMETAGLYGVEQSYENDPLAVVQYAPYILPTLSHSHAIPLRENLYYLELVPSFATNQTPPPSSPSSSSSSSNTPLVAPRVISQTTTVAIPQLQPFELLGLRDNPQPQLKTPSITMPKKASTSKSRGKKRKLDESATRRDINKVQHKITKKTAEGGTVVSFRAFGQKRAEFSEEKRAKTALTRRLGACGRCQEKKLRCGRRNLYEPCGKCSSSKLSPELLHLCVRVEIIDLKLHRDGSTLDDKFGEWYQKQLATEERFCRLSKEHIEFDTIYEKPRKIYVTQGLGGEVEVTVAHFEYEKGDRIGYDWVDAKGKKRHIEMPLYFICDMEEASRNMEKHARRSRQLYIKQWLQGVNPIIWNTFDAAQRYVGKTGSILIDNALSFWVATRLTEKPWRICGDDLLGVEPYTEEGNPFFGIVPVTPIMDTQIDEITIKIILRPLKKKVLEGLQRKIEQRRKEDWFEIYLTIFILLCNVEWILSDVIDFTERHDIKSRPQGKPSLVDGYVHACKALLSHFHCNNGTAPLQIDWRKPGNTSDILPSDHITYIQSLQDQIFRQERKLKALKDAPMYKAEMYWCYQALTGGWKGDLRHMGETLHYTEEDFLTS